MVTCAVIYRALVLIIHRVPPEMSVKYASVYAGLPAHVHGQECRREDGVPVKEAEGDRRLVTYNATDFSTELLFRNLDTVDVQQCVYPITLPTASIFCNNLQDSFTHSRIIWKCSGPALHTFHARGRRRMQRIPNRQAQLARDLN